VPRSVGFVRFDLRPLNFIVFWDGIVEKAKDAKKRGAGNKMGVFGTSLEHFLSHRLQSCLPTVIKFFRNQNYPLF
jgi:hypothetical protein